MENEKPLSLAQLYALADDATVAQFRATLDDYVRTGAGISESTFRGIYGRLPGVTPEDIEAMLTSARKGALKMFTMRQSPDMVQYDLLAHFLEIQLEKACDRVVDSVVAAITAPLRN